MKKEHTVLLEITLTDGQVKRISAIGKGDMEKGVKTIVDRIFPGQIDIDAGVSQFLSENCRLKQESRILSSVLFQDYLHWTQFEGIKPLSRNAFYDRLRVEGLSLKRGQSNQLYIYVEESL